MSFDVTGDQRVCKFRIKAPFEGGTCYLWLIGCMPVVDDAFGFEKEHPDLNAINSIGGRFDAPTHVTGEYLLSYWGSKALPQPSEGTWEARKQ